MKANLVSRFFTTITIMSSYLLMAESAFAGDDYKPGDLLGPSGKEISQIGLANGLELYDHDAADRCILGTLQVRIDINGADDYGIVKVELFGERDFMKKSGKLRRIRVPASKEGLKVCVNVETPGDYAISSYHDKDGDRKFDKRWDFKPKEPYGLSGNPKIKKLRLPKWEETHFNVPMNGADITINLIDPKKKD